MLMAAMRWLSRARPRPAFVASRVCALSALGLGLVCLVSPASAQLVEYYHTDLVGNVRAVTDEKKNVIECHDYLPFGEECTTGGCASNPEVGAGQARKFTGKERDTETGLDYFGARYYGSRIGRLTTTDPVYTWQENILDPQRWNRYAYGRNNPLRYVDPDGKDVVLVVRNNAGGGFTNFGHTAVRVFGQGYDVTYDFGRYAGGTGLLKQKGPGILRVWSDHEAFLKGQAPEGDVRTLTYKTSKDVDAAIMSDFSAKIAKGRERPGRKGFKEYQLADDYDLTKNNCTTMCLGAMGDAQAGTGTKFPGYEGFKDDYDPRDLYKDVSGVKGKGVTYNDAKKERQ
jgi:RHS repeat-associated protein